MFTVLTTAAELERDLTRERVKDDVASARRNGKQLGRLCKLETAQLEQAEILLASGKLDHHRRRGEDARVQPRDALAVHERDVASVPTA